MALLIHLLTYYHYTKHTHIHTHTWIVQVFKMERYNILILSFTKGRRWKALEFVGKLGLNKKETVGFKPHNCPPSVNELAEFESDILTMVLDR